MSFNDKLVRFSGLREKEVKNNDEKLYRVTVVAFEDRCNLNCGLRFYELLKQNKHFEVSFFNEPFAKSFLNLQGRNFFDFIDNGERILKGTKSDIVIWGYEEEGKIRLNFQIANQYVIPEVKSFSLLDSLFIPLSYFSNPENFSPALLTLIEGIIIAAVTPVTNDQKTMRASLLQNVVNRLAADAAPKDISREFMPYIMNMLAKVYLNYAAENMSDQHMQVIKNLLETALNNRQFMRLPIYFGSIYGNFAQLFETAFNQSEDFVYLKQAIKYYQDAQKYLNRNYPYDFGLIAYHLALLNFAFWKHTGDLQALRDAVSHLRDAEKVYSHSQFPQSWCHIEGLLGYYLTSLGMSTKSDDIMQLAIDSYKQQQKIYDQQTNPQEWAKIQEKIGNIYYLLGKQDEDDNFMLEARNYFNSALQIYDDLRLKDNAGEIKKLLSKVKNYID